MSDLDKFKRELHNGRLCRSCYYWEHKSRSGIDIKTGKCHRFPLETNKTSNDWCGEFKKDES